MPIRDTVYNAKSKHEKLTKKLYSSSSKVLSLTHPIASRFNTYDSVASLKKANQQRPRWTSCAIAHWSTRAVLRESCHLDRLSCNNLSTTGNSAKSALLQNVETTKQVTKKCLMQEETAKYTKGWLNTTKTHSANLLVWLPVFDNWSFATSCSL